jgi:hypothetical protein
MAAVFLGRPPWREISAFTEPTPSASSRARQRPRTPHDPAGCRTCPGEFLPGFLRGLFRGATTFVSTTRRVGVASPVCNGSVWRHPEGQAVRTGACNSVHERLQDDGGRDSALAPVGEACNAIQRGLCAPVAVEGLSRSIGRRATVASLHGLASTPQERATRFRSAERACGRNRGHGARRFQDALTGRGRPGVGSHVIARARLEDRAWRDRRLLSAAAPLTGKIISRRPLQDEGLASGAASVPLRGGQAGAAPALTL